MKPGGIRRLTVPPELGYGTDVPPGGHVPPKATLSFWIQLVEVK